MDGRDYYRRHSSLTDPGTARGLLRDLPAGVAGKATVIGGVMVHRDETALRFGFTLPPDRRDEANTRRVERILGRLGTLTPRPPEERFAGTCRDFAVLLCAMLREDGIPARARCGFARYFAADFFDDHWVVEVWDGDRGWHLVDAQVASAPLGTYRTPGRSTRWTYPATRSWSPARRGWTAGRVAGTRTGSAPAPPG